MKFKAVLFDCDGLMFNTEQISQNMWRQEAEQYHTVLPDSFFQAITGARRDTNSSQIFYQTIPHYEEIAEAMKRRRFDLDFWSSFYPDGLNKKGLIKLYLYLDANHIKRAVCSSSSKNYVETLLHTVSIPMHFDAVVGGDMVTHGKPDPEIFLKGAALLKTAPEDCLILEDSKQGIIAAKRAGMHSCFIRDTIIPDHEMEQAIDHEADDLSQVINLL